jgi:hypothetical protein
MIKCHCAASRYRITIAFQLQCICVLETSAGTNDSNATAFRQLLQSTGKGPDHFIFTCADAGQIDVRLTEDHTPVLSEFLDF